MSGARAERRILVVTLSNIGDVVMTTPVLETLAARYPDHLIDVLGDSRSSDVLAAAPWIGTIFHRDKRGGLPAQWRLVQALRRRRYALAVDLRTPIIAWLLHAERRLMKYRRRAPGVHAVAEHYAVIAPLAPAARVPWCRLHLAPAREREADALLSDLPGRRWLAVAPGANWPGKRWPGAHFRELLGLLGTRFDAALVLGGPDDRAAAAALAGAAPVVHDLTGRTDLPLAAALIARAAAFVGNDSGLGHVAAALAVPTVTVFGPGEPERYRPWGPHTALALAPGRDLERLVPAAVAALVRELTGTP